MRLAGYMKVRNWLAAEGGQNMVEYGLIILVVAIGLIVALGPLREKMGDFLQGVGDCLNTVKSSTSTTNCQLVVPDAHWRGREALDWDRFAREKDEVQRRISGVITIKRA